MATNAYPLRSAIASPPWVVVAVLLYGAAFAAWTFSAGLPMHLLQALQDASGGWLQPTLGLALLLGLGMLGLVFGPGRQRPGGLGWRLDALPPALAATLLLWLAMQASTILAACLEGVPPTWQAGWARGGMLPGALLAQLLGTALVEETVFRAWLWPQLALQAASRVPVRWAWMLALLLSQALFALLHVPARLAAGAAPAELAGMVLALFATGLVLALMYAATRSLFFVVGVHALGNAPTLLFEARGPEPTMVLLAASTVFAVAWWWWHQRADGAGVPPRTTLA
ncbi:CPBP family intramembrane glutamic endopeptidase [Luteimonas granuli]|uniref:CPBP family intramembrane metalloprotease n=1 Tax=Luteimonas granuli TaxID=1176533 RepID=A0A518N401_9GAMM|nr:CPBP family intramembrane glutamic endopeptidase [Luteimonas granuli]QDW66628.1 CPBP family intramembrane metalloprotease [Luteimonas granuli]